MCCQLEVVLSLLELALLPALLLHNDDQFIFRQLANRFQVK